MKRSIATAGAVSLAVFLAACSSGTTPTATAPSTTTPSASSPAATTPLKASADIVDTAVSAGGFTTLAQALTAAGLVDTLKGPGPFTVFAPTDTAFSKLPPGTVEALLKDPNGKLAEILKYHVVPGTVMATDVVKLNGQKVKTVQGAELTVQVTGDKVALVDATGQRVNVVTTDVPASNGVIHVIDAALLPTA